MALCEIFLQYVRCACLPVCHSCLIMSCHLQQQHQVHFFCTVEKLLGSQGYVLFPSQKELRQTVFFSQSKTSWCILTDLQVDLEGNGQILLLCAQAYLWSVYFSSMDVCRQHQLAHQSRWTCNHSVLLESSTHALDFVWGLFNFWLDFRI